MRYHYIITISSGSVTGGAGILTHVTSSGIWAAEPGDTRIDAFRKILSLSGCREDSSVTFYSLEPLELDHGG